MSLPSTIRVKLSSEAAEAISITRVVVQDLPVRELIEHMLGITGKDEGRIHDLLLRGTLVSGASRFRWTGWEADVFAIRNLLATFPDPEPTRPFSVERCVRAILRSDRHSIDLARAAGERKPLLRRTSFWDVLMDMARSADPTYLHYSYKDRADCYRLDLSRGHAETLRSSAGIVRYSTVRDQIRAANLTWVELYVER